MASAVCNVPAVHGCALHRSGGAGGRDRRRTQRRRQSGRGRDQHNAFQLVLILALVILPDDDIGQSRIAFWLAAAVTVAGSIQLAVTSATWLYTGRRWQRAPGGTDDRTKAFFRRALPGLIATGVPQLKLIAATAIASASPAAVSWLYYANRLYELPLGIASVAIAAVIVPRISASVHAKNKAAAAAAQSRAYEISLGLALPAAAGFALLAIPIAGGLFERGAFGPQDTTAVAAALAAICAGLPGHVLDKIFGAVSFAHEDTHTPMLTALCGLAAAIIGGVLLFPLWAHGHRRRNRDLRLGRGHFAGRDPFLAAPVKTRQDREAEIAAHWTCDRGDGRRSWSPRPGAAGFGDIAIASCRACRTGGIRRHRLWDRNASFWRC